MLTAGATHIQRHVATRKGSSISSYAFLSFEAGGKGWVEPGQGCATLKEAMHNCSCLSSPSPSIICPGALRSFGSVLVLEQFLLERDCIPFWQSVNSVVSLSAVSLI